MLRLVYASYRLVSGLRYRLRRRFTVPGLAVLGALVVAALMGMDVEKTIAYQAFAMLVVLVGAAMVFAPRFRFRVSIERSLPRFGTVGVPIEYQVAVTNLTPRSQAGLALLEDLADPRPSYPEWKAFWWQEEAFARSFSRRRRDNPFKPATLREAVVPTLLPRGRAEVPVMLMPLRRGVLRFHGATFGRTDPMGLFRSFARVKHPETTLILPKRYALPDLALPGSMKYQEGGVALASNIGRSEEFVSLREYRRGDPLRRIHWRSWAKVGRPIVKECEDEFFVRHALILDTFTKHDYSEVFEEAVSVAASFACTVVSQESILDLLFVGVEAYCFTAGRGLAHADQMLEVLAAVRRCAGRPFEHLETAVLNHVNVVSGCICVFIAWDEPRRELVRKLRALDIPLRVFVIVPEGSDASPDAGPMRDALDRFHILQAGRIEEGLANLT